MGHLGLHYPSCLLKFERAAMVGLWTVPQFQGIIWKQKMNNYIIMLLFVCYLIILMMWRRITGLTGVGNWSLFQTPFHIIKWNSFTFKFYFFFICCHCCVSVFECVFFFSFFLILFIYLFLISLSLLTLTWDTCSIDP